MCIHSSEHAESLSTPQTPVTGKQRNPDKTSDADRGVDKGGKLEEGTLSMTESPLR